MDIDTLTAHIDWQQLFDSSPDPVFLHDGEYRLLFANRAYLELAATTLAEAQGRPYWEIFPRANGP